MTKKEEIEKQYEAYANTFRNTKQPISSRVINKWVANNLNYKLNMCVSDFALPECAKKRCNTKELIERKYRGWYIIK